MSPDSVSRCKIRRLPQSDKKCCLPFASLLLYGCVELETVCSETRLSTADAATTFQIAVIYNLVKVLYNCTTFPRETLSQGQIKAAKMKNMETLVITSFSCRTIFFSPLAVLYDKRYS